LTYFLLLPGSSQNFRFEVNPFDFLLDFLLYAVFKEQLSLFNPV